MMAHISEGYNPKAIRIIDSGKSAGLIIAETESDGLEVPKEILISDDKDVVSYHSTKWLPFVAIGSAFIESQLPRRLFPQARPHKKCLLPGCDNTTNHRGGYCCSEHCKKHRQTFYFLPLHCSRSLKYL